MSNKTAHSLMVNFFIFTHSIVQTFSHKEEIKDRLSGVFLSVQKYAAGPKTIIYYLKK